LSHDNGYSFRLASQTVGPCWLQSRRRRRRRRPPLRRCRRFYLIRLLLCHPRRRLRRLHCRRHCRLPL